VSPEIWIMKVFPGIPRSMQNGQVQECRLAQRKRLGTFRAPILCRRLARKRQNGRAKAVACSWTSACWKGTAMDHRESEQFALNVRLDLPTLRF